MAQFSFSKLIGSQWIEQEKINCKGRRAAREKLVESNQIKETKFAKSPGGNWRLRKISE